MSAVTAASRGLERSDVSGVNGQAKPLEVGRSEIRRHAITVRSLVVATLCATALLLLLEHHEGNVAKLNLVSHDYTAPLVLGLGFAFVLTINGLFRAIRRGWGLSGVELAMTLGLLTVSYPVIRYVAPAIVGTAGQTQALLSTQAAEVRDLQRANPYSVLPSEAMLDQLESEQFLRSIGDGRSLASPAEIPWNVWARPLLFWSPLVLTFLVMSVSLGFMLYPHWAHRELVPFPLAEFASTLARFTQNRPFPDVFYNPLFWGGVGLMVFIYAVNGIHAHVDQMIEVPVEYSYYELTESFSFLKNAQEGYSLLRGTLYFTIVAVAFLLPKEISFTSWATWPVMVFATYLYYTQTGQQFSDQQVSMVQIGGFVAMAGLIVYGGRWFYASLVSRAFGLQGREPVDAQSVWYARLLLASLIMMIVVLVLYGLPLDVALLWTAWSLVFLTVTCRLVAEMGLPWVPIASLRPLEVILTAFGGGFLGARVYSLIAVINSVAIPGSVTVLPLSPAAMNAASIEDRVAGGTATAKLALPFVGAVLAAAVVALIYLGYSFEGTLEDVHARLGATEVKAASEWVYSFVGVEGVATALNHNVSVAERWTTISPAPGFLVWSGLGAAMVLTTGALRLRLPWFPLHPLPLLLLGSWVMSRFWFPFLVGWGIKVALLKVGGSPLFEKTRPLFVGIVIGQAAIATFWILFNVAYFWENDLVFRAEWWMVLKQIYSS